MTCCLNEECERKDTCARYKNEKYAIVNHKANCGECNEYKWYYKDDTKINKIEESEEK